MMNFASTVAAVLFIATTIYAEGKDATQERTATIITETPCGGCLLEGKPEDYPELVNRISAFWRKKKMAIRQKFEGAYANINYLIPPENFTISSNDTHGTVIKALYHPKITLDGKEYGVQYYYAENLSTLLVGDQKNKQLNTSCTVKWVQSFLDPKKSTIKNLSCNDSKGNEIQKKQKPKKGETQTP